MSTKVFIRGPWSRFLVFRVDSKKEEATTSLAYIGGSTVLPWPVLPWVTIPLPSQLGVIIQAPNLTHLYYSGYSSV